MDFNELIRPWKEGSIPSLGIEELRIRSQRCIVFIQKRIQDASLAKDAYDAEIRRKEEKEEADRLIGRIAVIDCRLETVERKASRHEIWTWGFWFAVIAIIIAVCSWLFPRSHSGAREATQPTQPMSPAPAPAHLPTVQPPQSYLTNNSSIQSNAPPTNTPPKP